MQPTCWLLRQTGSCYDIRQDQIFNVRNDKPCALVQLRADSCSGWGSQKYQYGQ
jgi:hypothetical protein